jgi:hypothetical protein
MDTLTSFKNKTNRLTPEQKESLIFAFLQFSRIPNRKWAEFFTITSYLLFDSPEKKAYHPAHTGEDASINLARRLINIGRIAYLRKEEDNLLEAFKYNLGIKPLPGVASTLGTYVLYKTSAFVPENKVKEYLDIVKAYGELSLQGKKSFLKGIGPVQRLRKRVDIEPPRRFYGN